MSGSRVAARDDRALDLVIHGASGFVGRLVAQHLAGRHLVSDHLVSDHVAGDGAAGIQGADQPDGRPGEHGIAALRIGLAGRSVERLVAVRDSLGAAAAGWPVIAADSADPASLARLASGARVVLSTVGPYARLGLPLVEACAAAGTDYADLTGEVTFVRRSIDACHDTAVSTGARLVHACGFDSIPSDLGVLLLSERARVDSAGELTDTTYVLTSARGGLSGGTIDSLRGELDASRADPAARGVLADTYSLSPDREGEPDHDAPPSGLLDRTGHASTMAVHRDRELGGWVGPFVMASFNSRIVRRSNALSGWSYGRSLRYREVVGFGSGRAAPVFAHAATAAVGLGVRGLAFAPTRTVLDRLLPKPGSGPSARVRRHGHFRVEIRTRTTSGRRYVATVAATGDPGYAATAVMFGEAGWCLAMDRSRLPPAFGVLTPATGLGDALVERLQAAGMTLTVREI